MYLRDQNSKLKWCHRWFWCVCVCVCVCSQEQSGAVIQLLRQFHALRSSLGMAVENALAVTHSLPDHNHSREEVRRILLRVRTFQFISHTSRCCISRACD